jgi:hypothetical protein
MTTHSSTHTPHKPSATTRRHPPTQLRQLMPGRCDGWCCVSGCVSETETGGVRTLRTGSGARIAGGSAQRWGVRRATGAAGALIAPRNAAASARPSGKERGGCDCGTQSGRSSSASSSHRSSSSEEPSSLLARRCMAEGIKTCPLRAQRAATYMRDPPHRARRCYRPRRVVTYHAREGSRRAGRALARGTHLRGWRHLPCAAVARGAGQPALGRRLQGAHSAHVERVGDQRRAAPAQLCEQVPWRLPVRHQAPHPGRVPAGVHGRGVADRGVQHRRPQMELHRRQAVQAVRMEAGARGQSWARRGAASLRQERVHRGARRQLLPRGARSHRVRVHHVQAHVAAPQEEGAADDRRVRLWPLHPALRRGGRHHSPPRPALGAAGNYELLPIQP